MTTLTSLSGLDGAMLETSYGFPFGMAFLQAFAKGVGTLYVGVAGVLLLLAILASFIKPDRPPAATI
jgi:hypothetical protein